MLQTPGRPIVQTVPAVQLSSGDQRARLVVGTFVPVNAVMTRSPLRSQPKASHGQGRPPLTPSVYWIGCLCPGLHPFSRRDSDGRPPRSLTPSNQGGYSTAKTRVFSQERLRSMLRIRTVVGRADGRSVGWGADADAGRPVNPLHHTGGRDVSHGPSHGCHAATDRGAALPDRSGCVGSTGFVHPP